MAVLRDDSLRHKAVVLSLTLHRTRSGYAKHEINHKFQNELSDWLKVNNVTICGIWSVVCKTRVPVYLSGEVQNVMQAIKLDIGFMERIFEIVE